MSVLSSSGARSLATRLMFFVLALANHSQNPRKTPSVLSPVHACPSLSLPPNAPPRLTVWKIPIYPSKFCSDTLEAFPVQCANRSTMLLSVIILRDLGYYFWTKHRVLLSKLSLYMVIIYLHVCLPSETRAPGWQAPGFLTSAYPLPGLDKLPSLNVSTSPLGRHFNGVFIFVYNNAKTKGEKAEKWDHLITYSGHSFIVWLHLTGNG